MQPATTAHILVPFDPWLLSLEAHISDISHHTLSLTIGGEQVSSWLTPDDLDTVLATGESFLVQIGGEVPLEPCQFRLRSKKWGKQLELSFGVIEATEDWLHLVGAHPGRTMQQPSERRPGTQRDGISWGGHL
jgi:hypothetical protein